MDLEENADYQITLMGGRVYIAPLLSDILGRSSGYVLIILYYGTP